MSAGEGVIPAACARTVPLQGFDLWEFEAEKLFSDYRTVTRGVPHPGDIAEAASIRSAPFITVSLLRSASGEVQVGCTIIASGPINN